MDSGIPVALAANIDEGVIVRVVVDEQYFPTFRDAREGVSQRGHEWRDTGGLVEDGNDD